MNGCGSATTRAAPAGSSAPASRANHSPLLPGRSGPPRSRLLRLLGEPLLARAGHAVPTFPLRPVERGVGARDHGVGRVAVGRELGGTPGPVLEIGKGDV